MSGVLGRPADVGVVARDGTVYLGCLPGGPIIILDGTAAVIWDAAQGVAPGEVAGRVAEATSLAEQDVAADVAAFVDDLRARRLLALT